MQCYGGEDEVSTEDEIITGEYVCGCGRWFCLGGMCIGKMAVDLW